MNLNGCFLYNDDFLNVWGLGFGLRGKSREVRDKRQEARSKRQESRGENRESRNKRQEEEVMITYSSDLF